MKYSSVKDKVEYGQKERQGSGEYSAGVAISLNASRIHPSTAHNAKPPKMRFRGMTPQIPKITTIFVLFQVFFIICKVFRIF